jgi:phage terminase large subunit
MQYKITTATKKIAALKKRIRAVQGGTSASKTISILMNLIHLAQTDKEATKTSIVSESFPHLARGAEEDFKNILKDHHYWDDSCWNGTNHVYTFKESGSRIEFFSADQPSKTRGPRRDRLFINEANNIPFEAYEQLEIRTREFIFLDWNPTNEFWYYEFVHNRDDCEHIILNYLDCEALEQSIIDTIESRKDRKGWWMVYGLGLLGEVEGKIYKDWKIIDDIPHEAELVRRGMDFGYSNDPSTIIDIYKYNGGYILDEILFQKGLKNKQLADVILNTEEPGVLVVADSAEPKSIDEIREYGVNILGAKKAKTTLDGPKQTYLTWRINMVQQQKISMTKRSINLIREYRNYMWQTDKDGRILNVPEDLWNHAMDALGYGIISITNPPKSGTHVFRPKKQRGYRAQSILDEIKQPKVSSGVHINTPGVGYKSRYSV